MLIIHHDIFVIRKVLLVAGLVCLCSGIISVSFEWRNFGALLFLASAFSFFSLYWKNQKYKEYKIIYFKFLSSEKTKILKILNHGSFEFTNDYLIYRNKNTCEKISWSDFIKYKLIDEKHVVMYRYYTKENNFIISEPEMDKSDYIEAIDFIKEKVEQVTTYNNVYN